MLNLILLRFKNLLPIILIASIVLGNVVLYFSHQLDLSWIFNSDVSLLPAFYEDVFLNGGKYSLWHMPAAPYLFPDLVLFTLAILITTNYYMAAVIFFTLQSMLIIYALSLIYNLFYEKPKSLKLTAITFASVYTFTSLVTNLFYVSVFHMGEFVVGLFSLFFIIKIIKEKDVNNFNYVSLFMLSILTIVSDTLYLLHFILPAISSLVLLLFFKKIKFKKTLMLILVLISSVILAYFLYKTFVYNPNKPKVSMQLGNFGFKFNKLFELLSLSIQKHTFSTIIIVIINFFALGVMIFRQKFLKVKNANIVLFCALFLLSMSIGNILAAFLLQNNIADRYMIPLFLLPFYLAPIIFNAFISVKLKNYLEVIIVILLSMQIYNFIRTPEVEFNNEYYPDIVKCFDSFITETGVKSGVSGYWLSKKLFVLSKHDDITIAQYLTSFDKFKWVTTENWYKPNYNFVLIDYTAPDVHKLDKNKTVSKLGEPEKIYECPLMDILYYKKGFSL